MRYLVSFSCGVPSAIAAKMAVEKYGNKALIYYCNTFKFEHPDNVRFFKDVEKWLGVQIKVLSSEEYTDIKDVWNKTGWLIGPGGARCTTELKKIPRMKFQEVDDVHILGFTFEEKKRIIKFGERNPELIVENILFDNKITRTQCFRLIKSAGIEEPFMYKLGYKNNNCIGCVKGGMGYWNKIREDFPEVFKEMAERERQMDVAICSTRKKESGKIRIRVFLDQLQVGRGNYNLEPNIECGIYCDGIKV